MTTGPCPTPTALKRLRGNPGKRPLNEDEPKPPPGAPKMPPWLDRAAKKEWLEQLGWLVQCGILTVVDKAIYGIYCQAYSDVSRLKAEIDEEAEAWKAEHGSRINPKQGLYDRALLRLHKSSAELGLTPSSRSRVVVAPKSSGKDASRFFGAA